MSKVSWLDSCDMESHIHIGKDGEGSTLCGYPFQENFSARRWTPYRVSSKRATCKRCLALAKAQQVDFKHWNPIIPARDFTKIPARSRSIRDHIFGENKPE